MHLNAYINICICRYAYIHTSVYIFSIYTEMCWAKCFLNVFKTERNVYPYSTVLCNHGLLLSGHGVSECFS